MASVASDGCLLLSVAIDTGNHRGGTFHLQNVASPYIAMADGTIDFGRGMSRVAEEHEIPEAVHAPQRDRALPHASVARLAV